MRKFIYYFLSLVFFSVIVFIFARFHYNSYLEKAASAWKLGNITKAIAYYEKIPKFIYPVAGEFLFYIHINPEYKVYNIQKAYSYIESYECEDKKHFISWALKNYSLPKNDQEYLENKIFYCNIS